MQYENLTPLFKSMSHPTRLEILDMLRLGELCVCHIENALGKRQAYISQQLTTLRETGLVDTRKEGLQVYYRLADERVERILEVFLGKPTLVYPIILEDCPCPSCIAVSLEESI